MDWYSAPCSAWRLLSAFVPARLRSRGLEPGAIDRNAVLGPELDRQVDREAVGVVEPERDLAGQDRRFVGQVLGPTTDLPLGGGQRDQRLLEQRRPGLQRPPE